jgi:hypothetical protein
MHAQAKSTTSASPADLQQFLTVLSPPMNADQINIEGVTGWAVEGDGRFHFSVEDGREADAHDRLSAYHPEWTTDLYHEEINGDSSDPNQPGVLLGIIERATASSEANGRAIDTVLIGAITGSKGGFYVQVTFDGSDWSEEPPGPHPHDDPSS